LEAKISNGGLIMKARRVTIMLEVITEHQLITLRSKEWWKDGMEDGAGGDDLMVLQAQANVIKEKKD
jgi:hypothetical protein